MSSSATTSPGRRMRARASATRARPAAERDETRWPSTSSAGSPTAARAASTRGPRCSAAVLTQSRGSSTTFPTLARGGRMASRSWGMRWTRPGRASSSLRLRVATSVPSTRTDPLSGVRKPVSMRATVLLPAPTSPTRPTFSPGWMLIDTSRTTSSGLAAAGVALAQAVGFEQPAAHARRPRSRPIRSRLPGPVSPGTRVRSMARPWRRRRRAGRQWSGRRATTVTSGGRTTASSPGWTPVRWAR